MRGVSLIAFAPLKFDLEGGETISLPAIRLTLVLRMRWVGAGPGGAFEGEGRLAGLTFTVMPRTAGEADQTFETVAVSVLNPVSRQPSGATLSHVDTGTWAAYDARDFIALRIPAAGDLLGDLARPGGPPANLCVTLTAHPAVRDPSGHLRAPEAGEAPTTLVVGRRTAYAASVTDPEC